MLKADLLTKCLNYRKHIYYFVFKMTYDEALSSDITQETYYIAIKNFDSFQGKSEISTWLIAIAKNLVYKAIGKQKKYLKKIKNLQVLENNKNNVPKSNYEYDKEVIENIKDGCLFALLACLPFSQRCAFILVILNKLSVSNVAIIMQKTENAIRILVMRAKKTIKDFLCNNCEYLTENPRCKCQNMMNFCINNNLLKQVESLKAINKLKFELGKFSNAIDLMKSIPNIDLVKDFMDNDSFETIFHYKVK